MPFELIAAAADAAAAAATVWDDINGAAARAGCTASPMQAQRQAKAEA